MQSTDTIVAPITAIGGAVVCIRLAGNKSFPLVKEIFFSNGKPLAEEKIQAHKILFGELRKGDTLIDEVLVSFFVGPKSYTGEDIVEISCHGSSYIVQEIIQLCLSKGARMATAGEFTQRAFLNGKMDLSQAEAVADLIASHSAQSKNLALQQLKGGITTELQVLREKLINFVAMLELELDFSGEDVEFVNRAELIGTLSSIEKLIGPMIDSFKWGNAVKQGRGVVILGKPNAGKSTLLNALLKEEKAIVSEIAGTTRDTIEDTIQIDGILFRFIDTAGLRSTNDTIEKVGIERAFQQLEKAAIVLFIADINDDYREIVTHFLSLPITKDQKALIVLNKVDTYNQGKCHIYEIEEAIQTLTNQKVLLISAKEKTDLEQLTTALVEFVNADKPHNETIIITNQRHVDALQRSLVQVQKGKESLSNNAFTDLVAFELKEALRAMGEITGVVDIDGDILGTIFGKFCIGK